ncbi:uncharacterized protein FIBRA_04904 [Fibroporia radiculosa]|uniref:F-box domain-containing protein n=1 Tax=Fibroporia radiculosa TaxID=599839 RepID=J4G852_9APHY|nr:uncharacterized protein FIBRA_04904 [Fibroporia radiculosa]CCM02793.1 predicted protein [Fibroporia radiculosa]
MLLCLAALPNLQTLHFRNGDIEHMGDDVEKLSDKTPSRTFPSLRIIDMTTVQLPSCTNPISRVRSSRVSQIRIHVEDKTLAKTIEEFFASLAIHSSRSAIQLLKLNFSQSGENDANYAVTAQTFAPLLGLNLRSLHIDGCSMELDSDLVRLMAESWPRLYRLELGVNHSPTPSLPVTLGGLVPLVQNCPNLAFVGLALDTTINKQSSTVDDPIPVASFLPDIFPNVRYIGSTWPSEDTIEEDDEDVSDSEFEMHDRWDEVLRLTQEFSGFREQERNQMQADAPARSANSRKASD